MRAWFSFHGGHSGLFCRHAKDSLEAVVERAASLGFTHYGLSEHATRFRTEDLLDDELDLTPEDLAAAFEAYRREALRLAEQWAGRIELFVGFETERLPPAEWPERMAALRALGFDYIVGSVHEVDGHWFDVSAERTRALGEIMGGAEILRLAYFDALGELVAVLRPQVVGHLDLVRKFEPEGFAFSPAAMVRIGQVLETARETGAVLDVNCGGWRRGYGPVYPLPEILELARRIGVGVTLGDDSHGVDGVGAGLQESLRAVAAAGYREVQCLSRSADGVVWRPIPLDSVHA